LVDVPVVLVDDGDVGVSPEGAMKAVRGQRAAGATARTTTRSLIRP